MGTKYPVFRGKHVVWGCRYHLVFTTKYRKKIITPEIFSKIEPRFQRVCDSFEGSLIECNYESDHVHLLVTLPPKHSVSKFVNSLKGVSSREAKVGQLWSPSYYVGTCGDASLETIKTYIQNQRNSSSA